MTLADSRNDSLRNRDKLEEYNTVDDAVALIAKSKKILVLTGAGVSVSISHSRVLTRANQTSAIDLLRYSRLPKSNWSLRSA